MKKLVISLLLLIAMLSSLLPLTLFAYAEDNETPITGGGADTALTYEDFYVKDASLVLWLDAFDPADGNVSLTDGTWRNLVTGGANATLLSILPSGDPTNGTQVYTQSTTKEVWEQYQADPSSVSGVRTFTAGRITYAEDGVTPLYASVTTFYLDNGESSVNGNTSVTIDGVSMRLFATVNTTYEWVEEAGVTTYVTESEWGESQSNGAPYRIYTDASSGTKRIKHTFTTEDPGEGNYTSKIEGGRFVEANIYDRIAGWKMGENGGVQSVIADFMSPNEEINVAIDLPKQYIPAIDAEYTLEIVGGAAVVIDTDGTVNTLSQNLNYQGEGGRVTAIAIGNMYQYWCRASTIKTNGSAMFATNYYMWQGSRSSTAVTLQGGSTNIPAWHLVYTRARSQDSTGFDVTQELSYYDGSLTVSKSATPYKGVTPSKVGEDLYVMKNVSNTTYAIRLYNRALTAEEKRSNHFGDLVRYYGLDLTSYASLSKENQEIVLENMLSLSVGLDKAEGTEIYNEIVRELFYVTEMNEYDRLYVQNGLSLLLTAYDTENEASLTISSTGSGKWRNKVLNEDGSYDIFLLNGRTTTREYFDDKGSPLSTVTGWRKYENGVGYEMTQAAARGDMKGSHYLDLGLDELPDNNYTVEVVMENLGMPMEGTETINYVGSGKNWYEIWSYMLKIGNFSIYSKHATHGTPTGIAPLYTIGPTFSSNGTWNSGEVKYLSKQLTDYDYNTLGIYNATFKLNTNDDGSIAFSYAFGLHGEAIYHGASGTHPTSLAEKGSFRLVADTPSILYAVRAYDRVLTEDEMLQNHFADLCAYNQLDMSRFESIPAGDRVAIYRIWKNYDFTTDRAFLQDALDNALSAILLNFEGFTARVEGEGNELSAIYSLKQSKINAMEAQGYKVTVGVLLAPRSDTVSSHITLTTETAFKSAEVYTTEGGKSGTIGQTDKFGYSIFFDKYTRPEDLSKKYFFRAYVTLVKGDETVTYYSNASGSSLSGALSMLDLCVYLTSSFEKYASNTNLLYTADSAYADCEIFVDAAKGNDSGNGSKNAPFKSVDAAVDHLNALLSEEGVPLNIILHILTGEYYVEDALTLDGALYNRDYRLKIEGSNATLNGNYEVPLSSFSPVSDSDILSYPIPERFRDRLFRSLYADGEIATLATTEQKLMTRSFTYFTENVPEGGTRKFADEAYKDENGNIYFVAYVDRSLIDQYFPAEQIAAKNVDIAGTELWIEIEWYYMGFRIVDIDYDHSLGIYATVDNASTVITNKNYENMYALVLNYSDASVYTKFKDGKMAPQHDVARGRDKASLKNSIYLLDEPGEYYYDLENGTVNYIPKDGEKTVGLSTVENLLILKDVANITIDGLTFTGTNNNSPTEEGYIRGQAGYSRKGTARFGTEAAIYALSASNLTIKNCNFIDLYASGIVVRGANRNIAVTDNVFDYVGSSAILMGDPGNWDPETNALTNITIENNYMHDIAYVFYVHCAITITKVQNLAIRYNSIINCPYSGISIGWSWGKTTAPYGEYVNILGAEVAYNYIENYMSLLFDGGAIYTIGGNAPIDYPENFNLLHDNYAYCGSYEDRNVSSNTSTCWYHDGASSHWHTYNNVVWVDVKTMSKFSYISMQGGDDWKDTSGSQAYNITAENNFFLNLYQDYLTVGYGRVKTSKNLVEIDSYVLTREDPYELADQLQYMYDRGIANQHGISIKQYMLINPEAFDFVDESMATEIDGIITSAGCDRQKGRSLLTELYEYQYKHVENPGVKPN